MTRRLFLLIPDLIHSKKIVADLEQVGVAQSHVHAIGQKGLPLGDLPLANWGQMHDAGYRLERFLWLANLVVFFSALVLMVVFLWIEPIVSIFPIAVMIVSFAAGNFFTGNIPNAHVSQFQNAINHREILLLVDVPKQKLHQVEMSIQKNHPEAVVAGVGWTLETLKL